LLLMKRSFIILCLLAIILGVLAGCTQKKADNTVRIRFVAWRPNQPEVWKEIIDIFERENPGIEIVHEIGPHSSTAFHDLLTQKLKNRSKDVDVFFMDVIWPPEFAAAGWAMVLDDIFTAHQREAFLPRTILANTYKGKIYGVPLFIDSGLLFYRQDLLDAYGFQPPLTWNELVLQAEKIVTGEREAGNDLVGYTGQFKQYEGLVCDMMEFILSNNGRIIDETGKCVLAEKQAVEAVRFVRDEIIGKIASPGILTYQEPESLDLFMQGRAVFMRNWPYAWNHANDPGKSRVAGRVGIAKLPHFPGGESYATLGGWQLGISRYSEHKKEAWRFIQFLTSARIQKLYAIKAGKAPTRKALSADREIIQHNPDFVDMKEVFLSAYPRPRSPLYPAISNVLQRYFSKVLSGPESDIEGEAVQAAAEIEKLLALVK
jgi:multiple sugar transport system substrate-binding protein